MNTRNDKKKNIIHIIDFPIEFDYDNSKFFGFQLKSFKIMPIFGKKRKSK